ncbi:conserved hypothetical protein [Vibrio nigripulchritudo SOn1]|uniref:Uncharacterized protein n=1 Tax=Vibrio nigripulchritudo SOn1 TaxID=1238450 RepID=A0AAV2VP16_9VIBR|nr:MULTISPECIES: hypothetical protein [Vibrio]MDP2572750.1 hypothetical protein [Vibrio penaeicida]CCO46176.1 conserved hypothetical protein [Vibrio nigripulchritudo SOn1]
MKLPTQAPGVDRSNRLEAAQAAGVNPAFWGTAFDILKKAGKGALQGVMS